MRVCKSSIYECGSDNAKGLRGRANEKNDIVQTAHVFTEWCAAACILHVAMITKANFTLIDLVKLPGGCCFLATNITDRATTSLIEQHTSRIEQQQ